MTNEITKKIDLIPILYVKKPKALPLIIVTEIKKIFEAFIYII